MKQLLLSLILVLTFPSALLASSAHFTQQEQATIQSLSGDKLEFKTDPSNKASGNPLAAKLGKALFFDKRLSSKGTHSCASCHHPKDSFSSAQTKGINQAELDRHTPHLWNVGYNRWHFWDGRADSLWAQALGPLENPKEMAGNRVAVARLIRDDVDYLAEYERLFNQLPIEITQHNLQRNAKPMPEDKENSNHLAWENLPQPVQHAVNEVFSNTAKAIAAFEETIVSSNSNFDRFARGAPTQENDSANNANLPAPAMRGLKLFIGKAKCVSCHSGSNFTDGEFHQLFLDDETATRNTGRYRGIELLKNSEFTSRSQYSDAPDNYRHPADYVYKSVEFRGQYKTPTLRNVAKTAPYMHNGKLKTLAEVINFYNTISDHLKPGTHQETTLQSLNLSTTEKQDLEAFLHTLTDESLLNSLKEVQQ